MIRSLARSIPLTSLSRFGVSTSGSAVANDAAFARLEAAVPGQDIDLLGGTYTVTAVPVGANYYNGTFQIGSALYPAPWRQFANPFDASAATVARYPGSFYPSGLLYDATNYRLWRFEIVSSTHTNEYGSRIDALNSADMGSTWLNRRTIFSDATEKNVRAAAFGVMSSGRWGGLITTSSADGDTTYKTWFTYSDDDGATWTTTDISASMSSLNPFIYGMMIPLGPSGDFAVYAYTGANTDIKVISTTDNGTTWACASAITSTGTGSTATEPSVVYVPGAGFLMFVRLGSGGNAYAATSADGLTFSDWVDTGVLLGSNPVHALYDGGRVHFTAIQRGGGFVGTTRPNQLMVWSGAGAAVYADPSILGDSAPKLMHVLADRSIGMLQSCRLSTDTSDVLAPWVHVAKAGEGPSTEVQTHNDVVLISQYPQATTGADFKAEIVQLVDNPIFTRWPTRPQSLTAFTTDRPVAGCFESNCSGATMTFSKVALTEEQCRLFPFKPIYGMRVESSGDDFAGFFQRWMNDEARRVMRALLASGDMVVRLYGIGTMPEGLRATLTINGSSYTLSTVFPRVPATNATAAWCTEVRLRPDNSTPVPVDLPDVTRVQLFIDCGTSVAAYDYTVTGLFLYPLAQAANMEYLDNSVVRKPYELARSSASVSHTGDTSETALATISVPGYTMGETGMLRVTPFWSGNNGAGTKTIRVRFSSIAGTAYHSQALGATIQSALATTYILNTTSSAQIGGLAAASTTGVGTSTAAAPTGANDTAADLTLVLSGQLADAADTVTLRGYVVEVFPDE